MAKVFVFFPDANDLNNSFLLNTENMVLHSTDVELKNIFDGKNRIDDGPANFIIKSVSDGEIPKLM